MTVRVQHLAWVSMKGEAKRDYPASINDQSPWWQDYAYVEDHFARLNTALTRGKPVVRVGVIHPVESYWLHWGPAEQTDGIRRQMDERFQSLTDWLVNGGVDFDFPVIPQLIDRKVRKGGTRNFLHEAAMTVEEMEQMGNPVHHNTLQALEYLRGHTHE